MTAVRDADRVLADIDRVLANRPIDLDELLSHPGQLHVAIANSTPYRAWLAGEIDDDALQEDTDRIIADEVSYVTGARVCCWSCRVAGDEFCEHCRTIWATIIAPGRVVPDVECADDAWSQSFKPVGPEVDGIARLCARYHQHMAVLK